jgi:hypothetical protein
MDGLIRRLSVAIARKTTRRDFLSSAARGAVGVGFGAAALFGAQRYALATPNCTGLGGRGGGCSPNSCLGGPNPDPNNPCPNNNYCAACTDGSGNPVSTLKCPAGTTFNRQWACCCPRPDGSKKVSYCTVCNIGTGVCRCIFLSQATCC